MYHTLRLGDGEGKLFGKESDSSISHDFQLGVGKVIQGYDKGLPGMCEGETRTLLVPPSLYGSFPGTIPNGATIHYTVELLKISDGELPPPPRETVF